MFNCLRQIKVKLWRRLGWLGQSWEEGLPDEILFWTNALTNPAKNWVKSDYDFRLDKSAPLQEEVRELFKIQPTTLRILDVGAGPLTALGKTWPGTKIEIIAVNPLADRYNEVIDRLGLKPEIRTIEAEGESLDKVFSENEFDIAYSSNALDHCRNPLLSIRQMLRTVRQGGWVFLTHFANEGITEHYNGLHQWNFDLKGSDFIIDNGIQKFSIQAEFKGKVNLLTSVTNTSGKRAVICKLQKIPIA